MESTEGFAGHTPVLQTYPVIYNPDVLNERVGLLASTEIWAGLGEPLSAIETKLCAPMQWLQSNAGIWALLGRRFVFGQDASQIQRQQLLKLSHNEDFAFGICFPIECHHASDYLDRQVGSKQRLFL